MFAMTKFEDLVGWRTDLELILPVFSTTNLQKERQLPDHPWTAIASNKEKREIHGKLA